MTEFEDLYDALKGAVTALGGAKKVGPRLRPEARDARGWLLNCLNRDHEQKLDPEQVALILRWAGEAGYHDAKHWLDHDTGYQPAAPFALEAKLAEALTALQTQRRRTEESEAAVRSIMENPKLRAMMSAGGINVEALL